MALAGTLAKSTNSRGDLLLKDKKELHENQLVVDDIKQQLRAFGRVKAQPPSILDLPTLWHLITHMEVALEEDVPVVDLVKRLHPTPALGVAPRRFGWRWMREWPQQSSRGHFGSPFLMKIDTNHWMCLVAIRNIEWTKKEMIIGSGCGVVRDSDLEREWLELFYKRESVKKILGMKS
jgi:menaquinone-specific isochorismate synthase